MSRRVTQFIVTSPIRTSLYFRLLAKTFWRLSFKLSLREFVGKSLRLVLLVFGLLLCALSAQSKAGKDSLPPQRPATAAQSPQEVTALGIDKVIERELASGQKHIYQLTLTEGQYLSVAVEPRGINLVARLFGTEGALVAEAASGNWIRGQVRVELLVETTGIYRLSIEAAENRVVPGHYGILATELHTSAENKRALNEAKKLDQEYDKLSKAQKFDEALLLAKRVLAIREAVENHRTARGEKSPPGSRNQSPQRGRAGPVATGHAFCR